MDHALTDRTDETRYFAATLGALFFWSTSFAVTKMAYDTIAPLTLGAMRFLVAAALLGTCMVFRKEHVRPVGKDLRLIACSGFLGITLFFSLQNVGLRMTSASNAALIVAAFPAITALLEWGVYKMTVSVIQGVGICLSISGVCILTGTGGGAGENPLVGNILLVASGFVWAAYMFATRKSVHKYPAMTFAFYQTAAGALFFLPVAFWESPSWQTPSSDSLAAMVYLALFCSVAAFLLYNFGLRKLTAGVSVSLMNLVPVFGAAFSIFALGEPLDGRQVAGGVVILCGVWCSVRRKPS